MKRQKRRNKRIACYQPNTNIKAPSNISQIESISYLHIFNRNAGKSLIKKGQSDMRINLPFHRIHDARCGYGFLICPTWKKAEYGQIIWIGYFDKAGFGLTYRFGFHNCTRTKIY